MSTDRRLLRLYWGLSAKERLALILRAWREGRHADREILYTIPAAQAAEYNALVTLWRGASGDLSHYVILLHASITELDLRSAWLATLHSGALTASILASYVVMHTDEPVTESEYQEIQQAAATEWLTIGDFVEDRCIEASGDTDESDASWQVRVRAEYVALQTAVRDGMLVGRGKGWETEIEAASYYSWRVEAVPVQPEWGRAYDVRPDSQREAVERDRAARDRARSLLSGSALSLVEGHASGGREQTASTADRAAAALIDTLRASWPERWRELRAVELVVDEVASELDGEDPLLPQVRQILTECRTGLVELRDRLRRYVGELSAEEPHDDLLRRLREIVRES